jgi:C-terminal peptidase prc
VQSPYQRLTLFALIALTFLGCKNYNKLPTPPALPSKGIRNKTFQHIPSRATITPTPLDTFVETPTEIQGTEQLADSDLQSSRSSTQIEIFEELWNIVDQEYLYSDYNGLEWNVIYEEYLLRIKNGISDDEFYKLMKELLSRLGDDHSVFLDPNQVDAEDARFRGEYDYVGIGVYLVSVPDRNRAVILVTMRGSPAEKAGLKPRDSILMVDGKTILDENGVLRDLIRGPLGTNVTLTVQSPNEKPRQITIERQQINSNIRVPFQILTTPGGKKIGYVLLVTFTDKSIEEQIGGILTLMKINGVRDGLIIDNRMNEGGSEIVLARTLSYFTKGTLGYFIGRENYRPLDVGKGRNINLSQNFPIVVLIGPMTKSYGEVFAGVLKDIDRAYIIGEKTEGNIETLWGYNFKDGSRAWIAHDTFSPLNHPEQDWETNGIIPDKIVEVKWEAFSLEDDPAIFAASDHIDKVHRTRRLDQGDIILTSGVKKQFITPK